VTPESQSPRVYYEDASDGSEMPLGYKYEFINKSEVLGCMKTVISMKDY